MTPRMRADNDLLRRTEETLETTTRLCIHIAVAGSLIGLLLVVAIFIGVGP